MHIDRLNQDTVKSEEVATAMKTSDILLVMCSAKSATGSLTQEEKAVLDAVRKRANLAFEELQEVEANQPR